MNIYKRVVPQLVLIGIVCLIGLFGYINTEFVPAKAKAPKTYTVIIDAGHGGLTNTID